ncbi:MAG TPA: GNAT family N-acetyltransferase [Pelobium sp.]
MENLTNIQFKVVDPKDIETITMIAEWYLKEWNIPLKTTIEKIKALSLANKEFQILMIVNGMPVATGGIYTNVGLLEKEPRLKIHKNWLALVYTLPKFRGKGLGKLLCEAIQNQSKKIQLTQLHLFTHTAESLYKRLNWKVTERIELEGKNIVIMQIKL